MTNQNTESQQSFYEQHPNLGFASDVVVGAHSTLWSKAATMVSHPGVKATAILMDNTLSTGINMTAGGDSWAKASLKIAANVGCFFTTGPIGGAPFPLINVAPRIISCENGPSAAELEFSWALTVVRKKTIKIESKDFI